MNLWEEKLLAFSKYVWKGKPSLDDVLPYLALFQVSDYNSDQVDDDSYTILFMAA